MKHTITYSAVVALSLSLCSLGLSGCGESADSEPAQPDSSATTDGSGDKDADSSDGSGDKDAAGSDEQAENDEDGL